MNNNEYPNEFSKFCPWICLNCRRDCVCCSWDDESNGFICSHNDNRILIIRKHS